MKCKVCGANSYSEYCFKHKPRKPLKRSRIKPKKMNTRIIEEILNGETLHSFYLKIWSERKHICQSCGAHMFGEPRTYHFDHLLEKSVYPDLKFEKDNILLVCFECHTKKTNGFPTDVHRAAIEHAKEIFLNKPLKNDISRLSTSSSVT